MEDNSMNLKLQQSIDSVEGFKFDPIKGYPMLHWKGKRPFTNTQFYPAQLKETHGEDVNGWINKIFWGDNLQVMSHLLKEFRGMIKLIYIDPPYDSRADYKKKIELKGSGIQGNFSAFEEKQYTDIWTNDEYLQFIYERLILIKELLSSDGSIYIQCDPTRGHYIKVILDEIFGQSNFVNQIIWKRTFSHGDSGQGAKHLGRLHDMILFYRKSEMTKINSVYTPYTEKYVSDFYKYIDEETGKKYRLVSLLGPGGASKGNPYYEFLGVTKYWVHSKEKMEKLYKEGKIIQSKPDTVPQKKRFIDESPGVPLQDIWTDINAVQGGALENYKYPTQKPEKLIERIILSSSEPNDIVFDCFMGSGTTQAVAMKLGRNFIGADINLGAIQTTTKRLINIAKDINSKIQVESICTGFQVFNVNHYDVFRNPVEAKDLLLKALEIQPFPSNSLFDGEKDGRMVKIMPINRIATRADLNELITNLDYKKLEKLQESNPKKAVESILIVCMGHEPDLAAELQTAVPFKLDIEVVDILRDKSNLEFKRDSEAIVELETGKLIIREFYPMNLLQKLSLVKENVENWKELTDSVMIDFNFDEGVFTPQIVDVPDGDQLVSGVYNIPVTAGNIKVKITDLLSESIEITLKNN